MIENLEAMLAKGQDNAMLRFTLGNQYYKDKRHDLAIEHLRAAVEHEPEYSAAWKLLGRSLEAAGDRQAALDTYIKGIEIAERCGDKQTSREMQVFKRRLEQST